MPKIRVYAMALVSMDIELDNISQVVPHVIEAPRPDWHEPEASWKVQEIDDFKHAFPLDENGREVEDKKYDRYDANGIRAKVIELLEGEERRGKKCEKLAPNLPYLGIVILSYDSGLRTPENVEVTIKYRKSDSELPYECRIAGYPSGLYASLQDIANMLINGVWETRSLPYMALTGYSTYRLLRPSDLEG